MDFFVNLSCTKNTVSIEPGIIDITFTSNIESDDICEDEIVDQHFVDFYGSSLTELLEYTLSKIHSEFQQITSQPNVYTDIEALFEKVFLVDALIELYLSSDKKMDADQLQMIVSTSLLIPFPKIGYYLQPEKSDNLADTTDNTIIWLFNCLTKHEEINQQYWYDYISWIDKQDITLAYECNSYYEVIIALLHYVSIQHLWLNQCKTCNHLFIPIHRREQYCCDACKRKAHCRSMQVRRGTDANKLYEKSQSCLYQRWLRAETEEERQQIQVEREWLAEQRKKMKYGSNQEEFIEFFKDYHKKLCPRSYE